MPSGLAIVAIAAIWVAILVPRMAAVYERSSAGRTTRRFQRAMAALGAGRKALGPADVILVRRAAQVAHDGFDDAVDLHLDHGVDPFEGAAEDEALSFARAERERSVAAGIAASRRRRTLLGLLGVTAAALGAAMLGAAPIWLAIPAAGVSSGAAVVILLVSRQHALAGRRRRAARGRREAARRQAHAQVDPISPARRDIEPESGHGTARASKADLGGSNVRLLFPAEVARMTNVVRAASRDRVMRPGAWASARFIEEDAALAATYADDEERLGLDAYADGISHRGGLFVSGPADLDDEPYRRVVNG
ncbi:MAG: hypothetical protein ACH36H_12070 [Candidatus Nanopelagicales bacterium]